MLASRLINSQIQTFNGSSLIIKFFSSCSAGYKESEKNLKYTQIVKRGDFYSFLIEGFLIKRKLWRFYNGRKFLGFFAILCADEFLFVQKWFLRVENLKFYDNKSIESGRWSKNPVSMRHIQLTKGFQCKFSSWNCIIEGN